MLSANGLLIRIGMVLHLRALWFLWSLQQFACWTVFTNHQQSSICNGSGLNRGKRSNLCHCHLSHLLRHSCVGFAASSPIVCALADPLHEHFSCESSNFSLQMFVFPSSEQFFIPCSLSIELPCHLEWVIPSLNIDRRMESSQIHIPPVRKKGSWWVPNWSVSCT